MPKAFRINKAQQRQHRLELEAAHRPARKRPADSSKAHPTAHTWYDELIVSTAPIADPL